MTGREAWAVVLVVLVLLALAFLARTGLALNGLALFFLGLTCVTIAWVWMLPWWRDRRESVPRPSPSMPQPVHLGETERVVRSGPLGHLADHAAPDGFLTFVIDTLHSQAYAPRYEHGYRLGVDVFVTFSNADANQIPIRAVGLDLMRKFGTSTKCQFLHFLEPDTRKPIDTLVIPPRDRRAVWASFYASTDVPPQERASLRFTVNAPGETLPPVFLNADWDEAAEGNTRLKVVIGR